MIRLRVATALAAVGALVTGGSVAAVLVPEPGGEATSVRPAGNALVLLEAAARAARSRAWSGTQHVVSLATGTPRVTEVHVQHVPGEGSALSPVTSGTPLVAADVLDESLLSVLAAAYDLQVVGTQRCEGRLARVVEARRPGVSGAAGVAGRFWLDAATGLVLRRDVVGTDGVLLRSSEIVDLQVGPVSQVVAVAQPQTAELRPDGQRLTDAALSTLAKQGWAVPRRLPGGMQLFDARLHDDDLLQLSYSDGLSTLSLFGQEGELPPTTTGILRTVAGGPVWVSPGEPDRVVWSEHGHTWTLVSDAPAGVVDATLAVLPHGRTTVAQDGLGPRVWRGMARLGSWLNPFD